jgi:hypothetical protein
MLNKEKNVEPTSESGNDVKSIVSGSLFNEVAIMEAAVSWCEFVGYDSKDEKIFNAFVMGAKLAISNDGWQNCR